jgi:monovalent cation:proton antiporter-2 (CPA2) family protein
MLTQALVFLAVAVLLVPLFQRLGLGAVLGYLAAGALVGPSVLGLVSDPAETLHIGEFGVVFMLFVIGLELRPARLWEMRRAVFGLGGLQVAATGAALVGVLAFGFRFALTEGFVAGLCLALSSTALGLRLLDDKNERATPHGRLAFAILLFQDLAAIPLIAFLPLLGSDPSRAPAINGAAVLAVLVGMIVAGRTLIRPLFNFVAQARSHEVSTAATLLLVIGTAQLMASLGLSMALGAFMAGVILAESEYRHELEANVDPFKGLFLGLFFIAIGMSVDFGLLSTQPLEVLGLVAAIVLVKTAVLAAIGRLSGLRGPAAASLGVTLSQGGEFAFVAFATAADAGVLSAPSHKLLVLAVSLSMVSTPFIFYFRDLILALVAGRKGRAENVVDAVEEALRDDGHAVMIAGFGRFGQMIGRVLMTRRIPFTALDADPTHVGFLRRFGNRVFFGDASRPDILRAAGAARAQLFILAIHNQSASLATLRTVRAHFPHLKVIARAHNRDHALALMREGVTLVMRDTLMSSLEVARTALEELGLPAIEARDTVRRFLTYDEEHLAQAVHDEDSEAALERRAIAYTAELEQLFEHDLHAAATRLAPEPVALSRVLRRPLTVRPPTTPHDPRPEDPP